MSIYSLVEKTKLKISEWREKLGTWIAGKDIRPQLTVTAPQALSTLLEQADKKARPFLEERITVDTKIEKIMFLQGARLYRDLLASELKDVQSQTYFTSRSFNI